MNLLLTKKYSIYWCLIPFLVLLSFCNAYFFKYFFVHLDSFTVRSLKHCFYNFIVLPVNLFLFELVVYLVGKRLLKFFRIETTFSLAEKTIFSLGLGLAFFSYLTLGLGLVGLLYKTIFLIICLGLIVIYRRDIRNILQIFLSLRGKIKSARFSVVEILFASLLLWCILNGFVSAIVLPTDWDTLAYHFAIPKLYLKAHQIFYIPWMLHANWPQSIEMLYTASFLLSDNSLAQLVNWSFGLVILLTMYSFCKQYLNNGRIVLLAGTIFLSQPVWSQYIGTGNVEIGWCMFLLLSGSALWRGIETNNKNWLWLSAIFCGVVAGSKILGLVWILIFGVILLIFYPYLISPLSRGRKKEGGVIYVVTALLVASPWYIKSFLWTGNPVWPFIYQIFDGRNWNSWLAIKYMTSNIFSFSTEWDKILVNLLNPQYSNYGSFFFTIPFILTIIVSAFNRNVWIKPVTIFFLSTIVYAITIFNHHEFWRFFMPMLPMCSIVWIWWLIKKNPPQSFIKGGIRVILIFMIILALFPAVKINQNNKLFVVFGLKSQDNVLPQERYLELSLDQYSLYNYINHNLPADSQILLFREIRGYYLDRAYVWGDPLNQGLVFYEGMNTSEELYNKLKELKITHVLINDGLNIYKPNKKYYSEKIINLMNGVINKHTILVKEINQVFLYELK